MKNKYIILDEIRLELVYDTENLIPVIFSSAKKAREYAENNLQGWQIIEVPFNEE